MPWTIKKQKCKQADGEKGNYIVKKTSGKSSRKPSCHKTRMKAVGSKLARERNESLLPQFDEWCDLILEHNKQDELEELGWNKKNGEYHIYAKITTDQGIENGELVLYNKGQDWFVQILGDEESQIDKTIKLNYNTIIGGKWATYEPQKNTAHISMRAVF